MMALPQIVSRNQTQKLSTIQLLESIGLSPATFYTCPAGKKAIVKGYAVGTTFNAANNMSLLAGGITIATWVNAGSDASQIFPLIMAIGVRFDFEVQLAAAETINYTQDTGTDAIMVINATVQETSV